MLQPALLGGLFIGVLSALPVVNVANCCCLWIIGGGAIAAYLEQQADPTPLTVGRAARVGLMAGVVGAFVWVIATLALDVLVAPLQQRMVAAMVQNAGDLPPDVRAIFDGLANGAAAPLRVAAGFLFHLVAGVIFSTLGGVLGSAFLGQPALGEPGPPPPPA